MTLKRPYLNKRKVWTRHNFVYLTANHPIAVVSGIEIVLAQLTSSISKRTQRLKHNANIASNLCTKARLHISSTPNK